MAPWLGVILALLSAGTLTSVGLGLIRLGRILERLSALDKEVDDLRSQGDALANRLTLHQASHITDRLGGR